MIFVTFMLINVPLSDDLFHMFKNKKVKGKTAVKTVYKFNNPDHETLTRARVHIRKGLHYISHAIMIWV